MCVEVCVCVCLGDEGGERAEVDTDNTDKKEKKSKRSHRFQEDKQVQQNGIKTMGTPLQTRGRSRRQRRAANDRGVDVQKGWRQHQWSFRLMLLY